MKSYGRYFFIHLVFLSVHLCISKSIPSCSLIKNVRQQFVQISFTEIINNEERVKEEQRHFSSNFQNPQF